MNRSKKAGGPYARVKDQYYLMLALRVTGASYRWEPHLIIDRTGTLKEEGVTIAAGPTLLLEYEGREAIIGEALAHGITAVSIPSWGLPTILLFQEEPLTEEDALLLDKAGLTRALVFLRAVRANVTIEEV